MANKERDILDNAIHSLKQLLPVHSFVLYILKSEQILPLISIKLKNKEIDEIAAKIVSPAYLEANEESYSLFTYKKKYQLLVTKLIFRQKLYLITLVVLKDFLPMPGDKINAMIWQFKLRVSEYISEQEKGIFEDFFHNLLETVPFSVFISNLKGEIIEINSLALALSKYSETELKSKRIVEITKSTNKNPEHIGIAEIRQADQLLFGTILIAKDGTEIPVSVSSQYISNGDADFFISFVQKVENAEEIENKIFKNILEIQNNERKRISRDLHDGLGPLLSIIKLYVSDLDSEDFDLEQRKKLVEDTLNIVDEAVSTTRSIANNLVPSVLKQYGLVNAISEFIQQIKRKNPIKIELKSKGKDLLDINVQMEIYQIIRELLNNSLKHAKATEIIIQLSFSFKNLAIQYMDNGIGFNLDDANEYKGLGLSNIQSRMEVLKGDLNIKTQPGKGLLVQIKL